MRKADHRKKAEKHLEKANKLIGQLLMTFENAQRELSLAANGDSATMKKLNKRKKK